MNSHHPAAVQTLSRFAEGQYQVELEAVADAMLRRCLWIPSPATWSPAPGDDEPPAQGSVVVLRRPERLAPPQSAAA